MNNAKYQVMPELSPEEYEALKQDIKERGVQVPEVALFMRQNHMVKNKQHKKNIKQFCNKKNVIPLIGRLPKDHNGPFSHVFYGYALSTEGPTFVNEGWHQYLQKVKPDIKTKKTIYFIRSLIGGPVKIGITNDLKGRLNQIQLSCPFPLEVIEFFTVEDKKIEKQIHERFNHLRLHGEWFEWTNEMAEFIHNTADKVGVINE